MSPNTLLGRKMCATTEKTTESTAIESEIKPKRNDDGEIASLKKKLQGVRSTLDQKEALFQAERESLVTEIEQLKNDVEEKREENKVLKSRLALALKTASTTHGDLEKEFASHKASDSTEYTKDEEILANPVSLSDAPVEYNNSKEATLFDPKVNSGRVPDQSLTTVPEAANEDNVFDMNEQLECGEVEDSSMKERLMKRKRHVKVDPGNATGADMCIAIASAEEDTLGMGEKGDAAKSKDQKKKKTGITPGNDKSNHVGVDKIVDEKIKSPLVPANGAIVKQQLQGPPLLSGAFFDIKAPGNGNKVPTFGLPGIKLPTPSLAAPPLQFGLFDA